MGVKQFFGGLSAIVAFNVCVIVGGAEIWQALVAASLFGMFLLAFFSD